MDWTPIIVQAIMTIGTIAVAAVPIWMKLHDVAKSVNGMKDELLATTRVEAKAEGIIQEKLAQQERRDAYSADDRRIP